MRLGLIALGHFLMDDAAAGGHPLDVARRDGAAVAHAVAVLDGSRENISDGLDPAVGMPGEAGEIIVGNVVTKVVEQQEWIEIGCVAKTKRPAEMNAGAFQRRFGFDEPS